VLLLWDVDTQVDFMLPGGHLHVPGAEKLLPNLQQLTNWAAEQRVPVISTACAHRPGDAELAIYGKHCMVGTPGQQKLPETLLPKRLTVANRRLTLPDVHAYQQIILEKQDFDFTSNPNHAEVLWQFGRPLDVLMYGVATDICVAAAARALMGMGHMVSLVRDAVAEVDLQRAARFLAEFADRGGKLTATRNVISIRQKAA
jgi:nicotinamidase/pyrazinamidase